MGSVDFHEVVWDDETRLSMDHAYRRACSDAVDEHGDRSYNGTISTTEGVRAVTNTPMSESGAHWHAGYFLSCAEPSKNVPEKWGAALAIPLARDDEFVYRTKVFSMKIDPADLTGEDGLVLSDTSYHIARMARREALSRFPKGIHAVEATPRLKYRHITENSTGTALTQYEVWAPGSHRPLVTTCDTKAQANAAAKDVLDRGISNTVGIKVVKKYPTREDGYASVMRRKLVSGSVSVKVTVAVPKKSSVEASGWLFYGLAAS